MRRLEWEKRSRLEKVGEAKCEHPKNPPVAGAPIPGERERDLLRVSEIRNRKVGKPKRSTKKRHRQLRRRRKRRK